MPKKSGEIKSTPPVLYGKSAISTTLKMSSKRAKKCGFVSDRVKDGPKSAKIVPKWLKNGVIMFVLSFLQEKAPNLKIDSSCNYFGPPGIAC